MCATLASPPLGITNEYWGFRVVPFLKSQPRLYARLAALFPDREFFMRSQGEVKFLKISSRLQMTVAGVVAGAVVIWLLATLFMLASQWAMNNEKRALGLKQAAVATSADRVAAYRDSVDEVAEDLERRQVVLENIVSSHLGDEDVSDDAANLVGNSGEDAANSTDNETEITVRKISAIIPEAANLARIEARQLAFVERLTKLAEQRSQRAETAIRKFGLNPDMIARSSRSSANSAQGGPFQPFFSNNDKSDRPLDPRFTALEKSLLRMDALERGLIGIPSGKPARITPMTSNFGYRRDPFTGRAAMHSGIDFKGSHGEGILAAAVGTVKFAGRKSGYGNCVEVAHGNGLVTRYAHLSSIKVRPGQKVAKGERLGGMGSTGRSTGTHLHFEVRMNNRAINPRPFLEANRDVLKIQASAQQRADSASDQPKA